MQIEGQLKDIAQSKLHDRSVLAADLIRVHQLLVEQFQFAPKGELARLDKLQSSYESLANPQAEGLLQQVEQTIHQLESDTSFAPAEDVELELAPLRQTLKQVVQMTPVRQSAPQVQDLQNRLQILTNRLACAQRLKKVQASVQDLLTRASNIEPNNPDRAIEYLGLAQREVEAARNAEGWDRDALDALLVLKDNATRLYNDARARHHIPTTRQTGEELVQLIIYFDELTNTDPSKPVTYFKDERLGADQGLMEVKKALSVARSRLIQTIWRPKLDEYVRAARAQIGIGNETASTFEHQPRLARASLERWKNLPGMNDPRVRMDLPSNLRFQIEDAEKLIDQEIRELEEAEGLAQDARREEDFGKAYKKWQQVKETYPYFPELEPLRQQILDRGRKQIETLLRESENFARDGQWRLLSARLDTLEGISQITSIFEPHSQARYELLKTLYRYIQPLTLVGKDKIKRDAELALLEELEQAYRDNYWQGWTRLQARLAELRAGVDIWSLKTQVDELCKPEVAAEVLEMLWAAALGLQSEPPENLLDGDRQTLLQIIERIKAWQGFVQARDELAKAQVLQTLNWTSDNVDAAPPDLGMIQAGLESARKDLQALQAASDKRLPEQLRTLKQNDLVAKPALDRLRQIWVNAGLEEQKRNLNEAMLWTKKANSYRVEFLELTRDIKVSLATMLEHETQRLIARYENNWFQNLEIALVEDLQRQSNALGGSNDVTTLIQGPLEIARAHRFEQDVATNGASPQMVIQMWERAHAANQENHLRAQYCYAQSRRVFMQGELARAQLESNPETAERIVRNLCEDPIFGKDPSIWTAHAQNCFNAAKALLRSQRGVAGNGQLDYLESARQSYFRSAKLAQQERLDAGLERTLREWEKLAEAEKKIQAVLDSNTGRLSSADCTRVRDIFSETMTGLGENEPKALLVEFWDLIRARARARAENELSATSDIFDHLDTILSIYLLFPEDNFAKRRLKDVVSHGASQIQNKIDDVVFDDSAKNFIERTQGSGRQIPSLDSIVRLQLVEAQELLDTIHTLSNVFRSLPRPLMGEIESVNLLDTKSHDLKDWIGQLQNFRNALAPALSLIEDGLKQPGQFEIARFILGKGGTHSSIHKPVPQNFISKGHPSYQAMVDRLERNSMRREQQERLALRISLSLQYEHVARAEDLPKTIPTQLENQTIERVMRELDLPSSARARYINEWRALLSELGQRLENPVQPVYPVMVALDEMYDMRDDQQGEPQDACGLQARLKYRDLDNAEKLYNGLQTIQRIIERKVEQVRTLREWLVRVNSVAGTGNSLFPGTVNWKQTKEKISRLRDSGPVGLRDSKKECKNAREGDENGIYLQTWCLKRAARELSLEEMARMLGADGTVGLNLCLLAQKLDRERVDRKAQIEKEIIESEAMEADIDNRFRRYTGARERFYAAHQRLMAKRNNWSRELVEFEQAAEDFCSICPQWIDFLSRLEEARIKTNSAFHCPD